MAKQGRKAGQSEERARFHSGFHDGAGDHGAGRPHRNPGSHPPALLNDPAYVAGYEYGWAGAREGVPTDSSESAWCHHQANLEELAAE